ncbi:maltose operon protein MalM [Pasteurellaceae bacterium USgator11]|nr:maltose operon protein MalM [Pasteurellaceae bacterium UScroc12]TNG97581.1 maltose operon protein MalM [Pasteurellaceae bacterium USgator41]TNG98751.1 maltose operon protein MalM [Pasteurellaceae bacterium UScroc31]TNG99476.1 maltose operon protein MalM [Pasteurellaceae bacterium USgator11]
MKKWISSTVLSFGLFCSAASYAAQPHINPQVVSKLAWQEIGLSQQQTTILDAQQRNLSGIDSPIAAYRLPANQGTLDITISSSVEDNDHIFVPNVAVLDANFNLAATYPANTFQFQNESGLQGNRLSKALQLTPTPNQDYIYLLIYTTNEDLQGSTTVPHPAKLYAKARGNQPPAIDDLQAKHSLNGKIHIEVDGKQSARFIGLAMPEFKAKSAVEPQAVGRNTKTEKPLTKPVEQETEQYFNNAIRNAMKNNDVNRAMNLVNEAEQLGLSSPRKTFIGLVSQK